MPMSLSPPKQTKSWICKDSRDLTPMGLQEEIRKSGFGSDHDWLRRCSSWDLIVAGGIFFWPLSTAEVCVFWGRGEMGGYLFSFLFFSFILMVFMMFGWERRGGEGRSRYLGTLYLLTC